MKPMEVIPDNQMFNNDFVQLVLNNVRLLSSLKFGVQIIDSKFLGLQILVSSGEGLKHLRCAESLKVKISEAVIIISIHQ